MSKHRQVALYVAEKAGGDPADRKQLLDMLGLLDPTGGGIVPDPTGKQLGVELTTAPYIKNDLPRTPGQPTYLQEKRRAQFTTPPGLRNLAPLPAEQPEPKPKAKPKAKAKVKTAKVTPTQRPTGAPRLAARRVDLLPPTSDATCGTLTGRQHHARRRENMCDPCRDAYNAYAAKRREQRAAGAPKRIRERPPCGSPSGAKGHRRRGEPVCEPCRIVDLATRRDAWRAKQAQKVAAGLSPGPQVRPACGSPGGAKAHRYRGEPVCEPCLEAGRKYSRENNRRYDAKKKARKQGATS